MGGDATRVSQHLCNNVRAQLALHRSIEAWIHSKKRNRLGQTNVERLVRTHTNLRLQAILQDWSSIPKAWDMETLIDEASDAEE